MTKPLSQESRRTYFNNPLIEPTLAHLPAALDHPTTAEFKSYLVAHLHQSSVKTRERYAEYISQRFAKDGRMNLDLARALSRFGAAPAGREILFFEMLQAIPLLKEATSLWLAEQPAAGASREKLLAFLDPRLEGRNTAKVAQALVQAWRELGKLKNLDPAIYAPIWRAPPIEAFLYVLARLYPQRTMERVDVFAGLPCVRALLWPRTAIDGLLRQAERLGQVSKTSELDQYHQFTLDGPGAERLGRLLDPGFTAAAHGVMALAEDGADYEADAGNAPARKARAARSRKRKKDTSAQPSLPLKR